MKGAEKLDIEQNYCSSFPQLANKLIIESFRVLNTDSVLRYFVGTPVNYLNYLYEVIFVYLG